MGTKESPRDNSLISDSESCTVERLLTVSSWFGEFVFLLWEHMGSSVALMDIMGIDFYYHVDFPLSPPLSVSAGQKYRQTSMNLDAACASKNTFIKTMTLPCLPPPVPMRFHVLDVRGRGLLQEVETQPSTPTSTPSNPTSFLHNLPKYKITYLRKNALPSLTFENVQT